MHMRIKYIAQSAGLPSGLNKRLDRRCSLTFFILEVISVSVRNTIRIQLNSILAWNLLIFWQIQKTDVVLKRCYNIYLHVLHDYDNEEIIVLGNSCLVIVKDWSQMHGCFSLLLRDYIWTNYWDLVNLIFF